MTSPAHKLHAFPAIAKNTARSIPRDFETLRRSAFNLNMLCGDSANIAWALLRDCGGVFVLRGLQELEMAFTPAMLRAR